MSKVLAFSVLYDIKKTPGIILTAGKKHLQMVCSHKAFRSCIFSPSSFLLFIIHFICVLDCSIMLITVFIFLLLAPPISAQITHGQSRILYENFDTPSLSTSIWNTGYPWGSYYNHRANTLPRQAKVTGDGFLNITATRERSITLGLMTEFGPMDLDFTSGAVNTNGKLCIKNGFIDISLRVPETGSTWPSVFLIPENEGALPMLTVMEVFNSRSRYSYGFRYTNNQGSVQQDTFVAENKQTSDGIHRYGLDWGYDQITWYYDDKWVNTITKTNELRQVDNMCLIVALGVGGKAKDTPIDPQGYPATMSINLVEVWQPKYDGYYKFQNVQTGLLMETDSASLDAGARVLQWHDLGGDWQVNIRYRFRTKSVVFFFIEMACSICRSWSI
jgi:beta-glucanase (GH16 family)